ncbi:MAG: hypothetical protein CL908_06550 [Deltaproteobacteria bacterium]|nr:hypothetical protein [Deltaproteobacteria bacterium]
MPLDESSEADAQRYVEMAGDELSRWVRMAYAQAATQGAGVAGAAGARAGGWEREHEGGRGDFDPRLSVSHRRPVNFDNPQILEFGKEVSISRFENRPPDPVIIGPA